MINFGLANSTAESSCGTFPMSLALHTLDERHGLPYAKGDSTWAKLLLIFWPAAYTKDRACGACPLDIRWRKKFLVDCPNSSCDRWHLHTCYCHTGSYLRRSNSYHRSGKGRLNASRHYKCHSQGCGNMRPHVRGPDKATSHRRGQFAHLATLLDTLDTLSRYSAEHYTRMHVQSRPRYSTLCKLHLPHHVSCNRDGMRIGVDLVWDRERTVSQHRDPAK